MIDTPRNIHLIMDYVDGGTVQHLVKKNKKIDEHDAQRSSTSLSTSYLHEHHVATRPQARELHALAQRAPLN